MRFRAIPGWSGTALVLLALVATGCSGQAPAPPANDIDPTQPGGMVAPATMGVVILGDSLTAGLGVLVEESFPSRLQDLFVAEGYGEVEIINAGVSGDTTAGGLRRIDEVLTPDVRVVVVALGGNDALRGLSVSQTRANITGIIEKSLASGAAVLLTGMEGPTNLGEDYRTSFRNAFQEIAAQFRGRIRFVPFLLEGVAGMPALNQPDGIHPNAEGAQKIAELLYPTIRDLVDEVPVRPVTQ
jgi:acyl-CoA thioesterase-1